ncbi:MAG: DUF2029 domain-containing protein [Candidatus Cloacimonetes bacterium]|nr:DUF2029 domain-containing protein [Candidatus Cloacimonadota bacterium]
MSNYFKILIWILLIYSIFIAFLGISFDTFNTIKYGGVDLRNRVVGARLLLDGRDPYFTKSAKNTPDYYVDGRDYYDLPVSRCTITPSLLLLHIPWASINYKIQQYLWFAVQEIFLLLSIFILAILAGKRYKIVLIIGFMFQVGAYFWRFHVACGQIYVLFLFLIILAYLVARSSFKHSSFWSGFLLGITATWRPPLLIMSIPFLIYKKWKLIFGGFCGIVFGLLSTSLITGVHIWQSYFSAMKIVEKFHVGLITYKMNFHDHFNYIEKVKNSFFSADLPNLDTSIQGILFNKFSKVVTSEYLWIALIFATLILTLPMFRKKQRSASWEKLFFSGSILLFISEFFLPAARLSYNNVIWFLPVSLLIIRADKPVQLFNAGLIFFILGMLANYLYNLHILTIMFADYSILIYLVWMLFSWDKMFKKPNDGIISAESS